MSAFSLTPAEVLANYAARYFKRHRREAFPTVREAARALRWRQGDVVDAAQDWHPYALMLTGYNFEEGREGDLYVELLHPPGDAP